MGNDVSTSKTWKILRYLLDPSTWKTTSLNQLRALLHKHSADTLLTNLEAKFFPPGPQQRHIDYDGEPNPTLDQDILISEAGRRVLSELGINTTRLQRPLHTAPTPDILKNAFKSDRYRVTCTRNTTVDDARFARRPSHGSTVKMPMQASQTRRHTPPTQRSPWQ
ncbi:hypothetical protein HPB48_006406 [Haemaphysalis longicornis]|uniref:Uncharacterized protein n=1 Tax=Haemaphysalis longicornis TaxID=44386 RepID=A0A9J6FMR7_HAELO|nr:hypothetical protein HPB48_006406 [Haemaphysalis longicornis]